MTEQLSYLVNWGSNKETAWSGTNFSLYKELKKYYNVEDIDLNVNHWATSFMRHILRMDETSIDYYCRHLFKYKLGNTKGKVFQFSEVLDNSKNRKTYTYVDLTVSYVNYMRQFLPQTYAVSAYQNINPKIFIKREKEQNEYIRSCTALFTMGHWLKKWLINQGFSSDNIFTVGGEKCTKRIDFTSD